MSHSNFFINKTFNPSKIRCYELLDIIKTKHNLNEPLKVLDLGCGTGSLVFLLAQHMPNANFIGLDISSLNIKLSKKRLRNDINKSRIQFIEGDYIGYEFNPFDLIISDSVLQNIPVSQKQLFSKINKDLVDKGCLLITIPFSCYFNHMLWTIRRILKLFKGNLLDKLLLSVGKKIHGDDYTDLELEERIHYAYLIPTRYDNQSFRIELRDSYCLKLVSENYMTHASVAQPKHKILEFTRELRKRHE